MRGQIEAFCHEHQLTDRVSILGWQSNAQIREAVLNSRFVTQPSFAEGLPVAIMEALALRRAVVTTYVAGIPELVIDAGEGKCGWLVPAGSIDALAAALAAALADRPSNAGGDGRRRRRPRAGAPRRGSAGGEAAAVVRPAGRGVERFAFWWTTCRRSPL